MAEAIDLISNVVDEASVNAEFERLLAKFKQVDEAMTSINTKSINLGGAESTKDLISRIAELEKEIAKLKEAKDQLINTDIKAAQASQQSAKATNDETKSIKEQADISKQRNAALDENIKTQLRLKSSMQNLAAQISDLKKVDAESVGTSKLSVHFYEERQKKLVALTKQYEIEKATLSSVNATIKQQVRQNNNAEDSLESLRAKLILLQRAYDSLGGSQRKSDIGKTIKKQLADVTDQVTKLEQGTGRFQRNVGNYQSAISGIGAVLGPIAAGLLGLQSVGQFFNSAIEEAKQAEDSLSRFQNTLSNLGKEGSFERLEAQATKFATALGYVDNDEIRESFTQLLTYGKLTEKQIGDLTPVILDFAAKQKISIQDATSVFIKGLEGNAKALKEYGINIKDGANVTERFGIIMSDLKPKVEGAAVAFGTTLTGQIAISQQQMKDLQEQVGNDLLPVFTKLKLSALEGFSGIIQGVKGLGKAIKDIYRATFDEAGLAADAVKDRLKTQQEDAKKYAADFISNLENKTVPALEKELQAQRDILNTVDRRYRADRNPGNTQAVLNQAQIVLALKQQIELEKEHIPLADVIDKQDKSSTKSKKEKKAAQEDENKLLREYLILRRQLQANQEEELKQIGVRRVAAQEAAFKKQYELDVASHNRSRDKELTDLQELYNKKAIGEEEYGKERLKIEKKFAALILDEEIKLAQQTLALLDDQSVAYAQLLAKIQAAKKARAELDAPSDEKKDEGGLTDKQSEMVDSLQTGFSAIQLATTGILSASIDKQKNIIQDQIDAIDLLKQKEIDAINATTLSAQEKADKIAVIEATAQAKKDALELKKRKLDQERAKFEKAASIASIIVNTAAAVVKALPNVPLAIATAALGAAQLAVAIATPIPKFKKGTKDAPGGLSIVGDGGRSEVVLLPSGEAFITPDRDTYIDLPKHSKVFPDANNLPAELMRMAMRPVRGIPAGGDNTGQIMQMGFARMERALSGQQKVAFHWKNGELRKSINNGAGWTHYLNGNGIA